MTEPFVPSARKCPGWVIECDRAALRDKRFCQECLERYYADPWLPSLDREKNTALVGQDVKEDATHG